MIKKYNPVTSSLRHRSIIKRFKKKLSIKNLTTQLSYHAGRNANGRITVRHCGGRHKRKYRMIDINRDIGKYSVLYNLNVEYDPNRKTNITRVYTNIFKNFYINNSEQSKLNVLYNRYTNISKVLTDNDNNFLKNIPIGATIYNLQPFNYIKAAGTCGQLIGKQENNVKIRLPSKKIIEVSLNCTASLGRNDNIVHKLTNFGKAGAKRWLGIRPTVKGNAMNAVDHPHGGNTPAGNVKPKTKWGKIAKWVKTRGSW